MWLDEIPPSLMRKLEIPRPRSGMVAQARVLKNDSSIVSQILRSTSSSSLFHRTCHPGNSFHALSWFFTILTYSLVLEVSAWFGLVMTPMIYGLRRSTAVSRAMWLARFMLAATTARIMPSFCRMKLSTNITTLPLSYNCPCSYHSIDMDIMPSCAKPSH